GSLRRKSIWRRTQPHALRAPPRRLRHYRPDLGIRSGDASKRRRVRSPLDEAPRSSPGFSRPLRRRNQRGRQCVSNSTGQGAYSMKDIVHSDRGPKPIGPYSQAVKINGLLYLSGQIPLDPKTNEMISGDIKAQTERVLENIKGILESAGSNLNHVVKTTVFLK